MGNDKFRPSGAPKPLNGFRWSLEFITMSWIFPHMQIHVALWQRGWSGWTRKNTCCGFLGIPFVFFALFFGSRRARTSGPILTIYTSYYKNKNWLQFLFIVKAAVLKQQISKFYPQIQRTEASDHIYFSQQPFINVKAIFCAENLRIKFWYLLFRTAAFTIKRNWSPFLFL